MNNSYGKKIYQKSTGNVIYLRKELFVMNLLFLFMPIFFSPTTFLIAIVGKFGEQLTQNCLYITILLYILPKLQKISAPNIEKWGLIAFRRENIIQILSLWFLLLVWGGIVTIVSTEIGIDVIDTIDFFHDPQDSTSPLLQNLLIFMVILSAVLFEEIFFRAYLLTRLVDLGKNPIFANFIAAFMFSLGHINQGLPGLLTSFGAAIILNTVFLSSRSLAVVAFSHLFYNLFIFLLL